MESLESMHRRAAERRLLPYAVDFVKFSVSFVVILAIALFALHAASLAAG
ncbi:MAG TPA: hypothetical protein VMV50_02855 [Candidatus Paceibacterota bacterium]|nr:hypothetical protein [Candidatus Paceibacterota bacterium]